MTLRFLLMLFGNFLVVDGTTFHCSLEDSVFYKEIISAGESIYQKYIVAILMARELELFSSRNPYKILNVEILLF